MAIEHGCAGKAAASLKLFLNGGPLVGGAGVWGRGHDVICLHTSGFVAPGSPIRSYSPQRMRTTRCYSPSTRICGHLQPDTYKEINGRLERLTRLSRMAKIDWSTAKKEEEWEALSHFMDAYRLITGETFDDIDASETPDFLAQDAQGKIVGIELTQIKTSPEEMFLRRVIENQEWMTDEGGLLHLLNRMHSKEQKLQKGNWATCERRILIIQLVDYPLSEMAFFDFETELPTPGSFTEIWLVDYTTIDAFAGVDLFALVHPTLKGEFPTATKDRKPFS